jgi:hypothetical protein
MTVRPAITVLILPQAQRTEQRPTGGYLGVQNPRRASGSAPNQFPVLGSAVLPARSVTRAKTWVPGGGPQNPRFQDRSIRSLPDGSRYSRLPGDTTVSDYQ